MDTSNMRCASYNRTKCERTGRGCGGEPEHCRAPDGNDRLPTLCFALWQNSSDRGLVPEFKGCWVGSAKDCVHQSQCIENRREAKKQLYFCCCEGDLCNTDTFHIPTHNLSTVSAAATSSLNGHHNNNPSLAGGHHSSSASSASLPVGALSIALITIVPLLTIVALVAIACMCRNYRQKWRQQEVPNGEDPLLDLSPPSPYVGLKPITLQEVKANGKFGSVWKATDGSDNSVAVKIFALQDRQSWQIEQEVYRLPQMKHQNVLKYLGTERRGEGLNTEYWLITEYHYNGSLWDYLKANTVDWSQLLNIAQGIARGLTHLHEEIPASHSSQFKPSIAHRDFKSKNVLLTKNLNACIADFGLALVFYPKSTCGDAHGQVGTRRYMAPEVLEGAINFSRDSFLRIDMYACGLVLWELMSRCRSSQDMQLGNDGDYQLPFEEEVGQHPSLEDMQDIVAQQKRRPAIRPDWTKHDGMNVLCHTIEDCWDHDAEARLSASCVDERISAVILCPNVITN
ncbi:activin receptor type-2A-like [Oppia nitens]|uniref:activin receptor type-2A-like n=1 Tax=Oppia nitens TaxID=1686743 RepID=UPI0023D993E2|nr:activin receptor type-2A-like [Oppia nitens]